MSIPLIIAHRGASAVAPENTMAAFRLALKVNADGIEFDVRLTKDGVPVVIHDEDLKRTGGVSKKVANLTLSELKQIDVGHWFTKTNVNFAGEPVPTLLEVFDLFRPTSSLLYLEMKSDSAHREELAQTCCAALRHSGLKSRVIVECFDLEALKTIKELDSEIKTAALFEPGLKNPAVLIDARKLIDKALAVRADEIALARQLANVRTVDAARAVGLNVVVWTVDDPKWIARARARSITALISNNPQSMIEARDDSRLD